MTPKSPLATAPFALALLLAALAQGCGRAANPDAAYVDTQQGPFPANSASTSTSGPGARTPASGRLRSPGS